MTGVRAISQSNIGPLIPCFHSWPANGQSEDKRVERLLRLAEILDEDWMRLFEMNVLSGVRLTRNYLAGLLKKNGGRVIFIFSESGQNIPAEMIPYGMT